jgi:alkanesulfonate monooxygenase SsuD/methylene tetrahydromethanopterin reductase-like flavin-dependent oxidoreductase (luciferase family)
VATTTAYPYSVTGAFPLGPDEPWLECLTAVTYLATVTRRIRVGTSVLVIPYRHPIVTARALATADYLSGGRVILGVGIGWWREEFEALGVPFEERAARTVEALRLMREIWTKPRVAFAGRFWQVRERGPPGLRGSGRAALRARLLGADAARDAGRPRALRAGRAPPRRRGMTRAGRGRRQTSSAKTVSERSTPRSVRATRPSRIAISPAST